MGPFGNRLILATGRLGLLSRQNHGRRGVHGLLRGHTDTVNAVKIFSAREHGCPTIVSGSADRTVRIWQYRRSPCEEFQQIAVLEGHKSSVNCCCVIPEQNLVVSGSADGAVKAWWLDLESGYEKAVFFQDIQASDDKLIPLALASGALGSNGDSILAVAGTKGIVSVYTAARGCHFKIQATLLGHESWVRALAITQGLDAHDMLLASASQDRFIRLWRIRKDGSVANDSKNQKRNFMVSLSNKVHRLQTLQDSYLVTFEALLFGHEDWIYSVQWHRKADQLRLLSASADNSLAMWQVEESSGIWVCSTRLGEISSQKGSTTATGSIGGFWIGLWSPTGNSVVSLGKMGSWRLWNFERYPDRWTPLAGISGHVGSVSDVAWARDGSYMLSSGLDQTTRLHAPWRKEGSVQWYEFARPQVHGYDLNCIDSIGRFQFVSGADEKALRVFNEPRRIAELLQRSCGVSQSLDQAFPEAADIPVLGLSNKAFQTLENVDSFEHREQGGYADAKDLQKSTSRITLGLEGPPLEDDLARHTLWPEEEKLYGHGYEISAVVASHDGTVIATACKATSIEHAVIRLYDTKGWYELKPPLTAHSLTVTCLRFSQDDKYLLSVGRDRKWVVFERTEDKATDYRLRTQKVKAHSRMILSASWAPFEVGVVFATAGRDKIVKLWKLKPDLQDSASECLRELSLTAAVTAVDLLSKSLNGTAILALGTEEGGITVLLLNTPGFTLQQSFQLDNT